MRGMYHGDALISIIRNGAFAYLMASLWIGISFAQSNSWAKELPGIGTFSSPRLTDLNGDGIKDIILGAGRAEFQHCDSAVIALDGNNGQLLWNVSAKDQMFGSAALRDINGDGVNDIVINGRSAELKAINGKNGHLLWEFYQGKKKPASQGWYNFYNPQWVSDLDGDGIKDILISNGGDVMVEPYDPNRPAGKLVLISGANGTLIAEAKMPDGKEIYMSIAIREGDSVEESWIAFGSGGETIGGHLYVASLACVLKGDLSTAQELTSSPDKGFIAPPVWVDINMDQVLDLVAVAVEGEVFAYDGKDFSLMWNTPLENTEAYSSIAVGYFTADRIPDFFLSVAQGNWPKLEWNRQFMLNGRDGKIVFQDSLGFYQTSTAVAVDLTGNKFDELLLSLNYQEVNELYQKTFYNMLVAIDTRNKKVLPLGDSFNGSNLASTPWIGDVDDDGFLDIIYVHGTNLKHTYTFDGMKVERLSTQIPYRQPSWGAYMGNGYDGIFRP